MIWKQLPVEKIQKGPSLLKARPFVSVEATKKFKPEYKHGAVIKALQKSRGLISYASQILGCHPNTIRKQIERYPVIAAAYHDAKEKMLDVAENQLFAQVEAGEAWAICFYLKTQGWNRGYIERRELSGNADKPIHVRVEDARDELAARITKIIVREQTETNHSKVDGGKGAGTSLGLASLGTS